MRLGTVDGTSKRARWSIGCSQMATGAEW